MTPRSSISACLAAVLLASAAAAVPPTITWFSIDCGGSTSTGGPLTLVGTIGQPDAAEAPLSGSGLTLVGGYRVATTCAPDFDGNGVLAVADIFAYLNAWFAGDIAADFNGTSALEVADIFAFLNAWFAGCP